MEKYLLIGLALGAGLYLRGKYAAAPVKTSSATTPAVKNKAVSNPVAQRKAPVKPVANPAAVVTINDVRANNMLMVTGQQAGWLPKYQPNASKNKHRQGKAVK